MRKSVRRASLPLARVLCAFLYADDKVCTDTHGCKRAHCRVADELCDVRIRTYVRMIATDRCISLGMHLRACWTSFAETLMDKRSLYGRRKGVRRGRLHIYVMTPLHST